tara:strand:- start:3376 stop:3945 length:570 start_codon:yes stop_codon:yes gene_type:complete
MKKYLIVGLGNIGDQYFETRHNIGFMILNFFADSNDLSFEDVKYGNMCKFKLKGRTFIFLKPNTYMNLSGKSVKYWLSKENISIENLLVISDDLNLPLSSFRLRSSGSSGGHNGLLDIENKLNTISYSRLRVGISNDHNNYNQIEYVLGKLNEEELKELYSIFPKICELIISFVMNGIDFTMNHYNSKK